MTWDELAIGDFCRTGSGGTPSRKKDSIYFGGNISWVKSGELREGVITETEETITELAVIESSAKFIPKGALLVAMYGATIGRVAKLGIDATSNQAVCHILPDESLADMQYMFHALQAQAPHWLGKGVGGAQPNISQEIIKNTLIPLPPLEEQRRIAAILDRVQDLERHAESQIKKLNALANSSFQKSIDEARFQGTLKEESLGSISIVAGQYGANCSSAPYDASLPRYVRITDIQDDGLLSPVLVSPAGPPNGWADLRLDPGDLLFARSGATVGKTYMHTNGEGDCVFAGYLIRFRLDARIALPEFVYGFTRTEGYRAWVTNTQRAVAQPYINAQQYSSLTIPLPPLDEQQAYCAIYRHIKKLSEAAREMRYNLLQLRHSLSRNLFDHQGDLL